MLTGWEIVIAGRNFDPAAFLETSIIQPTKIWEREVEEDGERHKQRGIEFSDWHEGAYRLDMVTEALDYLGTHRIEFQKLLSLPGIDDRCLNFVDTSCHRNLACVFDFTPERMSLLASLELSVSIVIPSFGEPGVKPAM
jgi:hypothetical protein